MSVRLLGLAGLTSAPAEPDSARMEELEEGGGGGALPPRPGELDLEELATLAAELQPENGALQEGPDPELLSVYRQKEKDLILAARLGKALLERNQDMSRQYERIQRELQDKLEHLEQEKHELRRRFENREGEWEGRVSELESDVKVLQDELEKQQVHLREADREKTRAIQDLSEQNQRLMDQLTRATEVERQLSLQVHVLREEFREKSTSTSQHIVRLETLQAEINMLSDRKRDLEKRLGAMMEENDLLQGTVEELQDRIVTLDRQSCDKDLQLRQSQQELQELRHTSRQLQRKMEELNEERNLQNFNSNSTSLLSEIEQSMEAEEQEQERVQGSRRSDDEALEEQIKRTSEDSRALRELLHCEQHSMKQSLEELQRLHNQVTQLSVEMCSIKEERDRLRSISEDKGPKEQLAKAIRDRDEAIAKKNAVEMELAKCRIDVMSLNSQLLDAIQQKLNLSQQLEAWQDDMHRVIDQQLMDKHQDEWNQTAYSFSSRQSAKGSSGNRSICRTRTDQQGEEPIVAEGKRRFTFFKKN
ncbi:BICD family-like cargo adapter 1 isoform X2 [Ambystoma mexicanum]|uniref:BICD family-like cargo adapter 1 isoform X2 n=1 Tax=Ambystoma mexicanum TaxID=8296 RepID=UPI0037E87125